MRKKMFSILVVALNPGEKLVQTIQSIWEQTCKDYEVVVKDGGSKDDSLQKLEAFLEKYPEAKAYVRVIAEQDKSIYEGMNQATKYAEGQYYYFLNCGDVFAHERALENMAQGIRADRQQGGRALIYYGNIYDALRGQVVQSNPKIDAFACYRNVPCHQACFYDYSLFEERGYEPKYRVRGDYEHFLWSYFCKNAQPKYVDVVLASYEGGGFSETKENIIRSKQEHQEITKKYMSKGQLLRYKGILLLTLAPLRRRMAESKRLAGVYQTCKKWLYRRNN
ncbi:MAG: glycosyltransferase [Lachnospiraceae bacterium]|nr:glycosyltransferase [Lachnospiraceae bacterium]